MLSIRRVWLIMCMVKVSEDVSEVVIVTETESCRHIEDG